jgi:hypothetical protein
VSTTPATDAILAAFEPWLEFDTNGNLRAYLSTLGGMLDPVAFIVTDQGFPDATDGSYVPGWSNLLDPNNCPTQFLPFLSTFNGTGVQPGTDDATARAIIKAEAGFKRGTYDSIVAAAQRNLTGTKTVAILERTAPIGPDAYHFVLQARPEECPDATALRNAVDSVRPAGIQWTLVLTDGWTIFQMEVSAASVTALEGNFTTLTGLETDNPGH